MASVFSVGVVLCVLAVLPAIGDGPGSPDRSFGKRGIVADRLGSSSGQIVTDSALQPDGHLVLVGRTSSGAAGIIARYRCDGSLDPEFGQTGIVTWPRVLIDGIAIDPSGRVAATGRDGDEAVVVRLRADGSIDPDFGSDGIVTTRFGPMWPDFPGATPETPRLSTVSFMADGSILAAGTGDGCQVETDCRFAIAWRVGATGEPLPLDEGSDGTWVDAIPGLKLVTLLPDGRMLIGSAPMEEDFDGGEYPVNRLQVYSAPDQSGARELVWRDSFGHRQGVMGEAGRALLLPDGGFFLASGTLILKAGTSGRDDGFGSFGILEFNSELFRGAAGDETGSLSSIAIDHEGRLIVAGVVRNRPYLARVSRAGVPDPTFANFGFTQIWTYPQTALGHPEVFVQAERYLVVASASTSAGTRFSITAVRGGNRAMAYCDGRKATWIGGPGRDHVRADSGVIVTGAGGDLIEVQGWDVHTSVADPAMTASGSTAVVPSAEAVTTRSNRSGTGAPTASHHAPARSSSADPAMTGCTGQRATTSFTEGQAPTCSTADLATTTYTAPPDAIVSWDGPESTGSSGARVETRRSEAQP